METQNSSFSDLPDELLSDISERFGLIDLLSFRGICKNTRSASSDSSGAIEEQSSSQCIPWFLLYGDGPNCSIVTNTNNNRPYKINLPEIADSTCVFSLDGWLLFLSPDSSMFFFCPFSKSRIDLPNCPFNSTDSNFAAAFSHSPTNRDCAVVVLRCSIEKRRYIEICLLRRGDNEWRKYEYSISDDVNQLREIESVMHHEGAFHFLDGSSGLGIFYDKIQRWSTSFTAPVKNKKDMDKSKVVYLREHYFFGKKSEEIMSVLGIEEACSITICGTLISKTGFEYHLIDHEKYIDETSETEDDNGDGLLRELKGVWIQPRFHQIPLNQSWSL